MTVRGRFRRLAISRMASAAAAAAWTWIAVRKLRRSLAAHGVAAPRPRAVKLPGTGAKGVAWALDRSNATCLERSLIWQARVLAQSGWAPDVIVGVRVSRVEELPTDAARDLAHAWLDGEPAPGYQEIHRLKALP